MIVYVAYVEGQEPYQVFGSLDRAMCFAEGEQGYSVADEDVEWTHRREIGVDSWSLGPKEGADAFDSPMIVEAMKVEGIGE